MEYLGTLTVVSYGEMLLEEINIERKIYFVI